MSRTLFTEELVEPKTPSLNWEAEVDAVAVAARLLDTFVDTIGGSLNGSSLEACPEVVVVDEVGLVCGVGSLHSGQHPDSGSAS